MSSPSSLPHYPLARRCPLDPPDEIAEYRRGAPMTKMQLWDGSAMWLATRYDTVRRILADPRFSAVPTRPGYPIVAESRAAMLRAERNNFAFMDDPEHHRFRRMLARMFTVQQIEKLRPQVQAIVDRLVGEMAERTPPVDLVEVLALPVPSLVISELLGVPYGEHEFFQKAARSRVNLSGDPAESAAAGKRIWDYMDSLLAKREHEPGDDLLSRLVVEQIRPGHLERDDAIGMARALLLAGHDTTATQIGAGVLTLLQHPDQIEMLKADPSLIPGAVEEILRYFTITQHNAPRVALEDVEIDGITIAAGQGVIASLSAANWDPDVFEDPGRFDIRRRADNHLAFAFGPHQCLGQALARLELQIVFATLFARIPGLRLAVSVDSLRFKHDSLTYGVHALPVTW